MFAKIATLVSVLSFAAPAVAQDGDGSNLGYAAENVREEAAEFVRILGYQEQRDHFELISAGGMLAKEADELARASDLDPYSGRDGFRGTADREYREVQNAWRALNDAWSWIRIRSHEAARQMGRIAAAIRELEYVYGYDDGYEPGYPGQGNPGQGNPGQGNPGQGNPGQGNPGQGNPGQGGYSGQGNPGQGGGDHGEGDTGVIIIRR